MDLPITIYFAPSFIAKLGVPIFFWSFLSSFLRRIPGVTIKSNISFVLYISEAGQITPSTPHSFASLNSLFTSSLTELLIALLVNALLHQEFVEYCL